MSRDYFREIGEYDMGMEIWGVENIELSIRVGPPPPPPLHPSFLAFPSDLALRWPSAGCSLLPCWPCVPHAATVQGQAGHGLEPVQLAEDGQGVAGRVRGRQGKAMDGSGWTGEGRAEMKH